MTRRTISLRQGLGALALLCASAIPASGQIVFDHNVLFDNPGANGDYENDAAVAGPCFNSETALGETTFTHNQSQDAGEIADPKIIDPYNEVTPNWRPQAGMGSAALNESPNYFPIAQLPDDGFFTQKCFRGALSPVLAEDWTQGWTYYSKNGAGRTDIDYGKPLAILTGQLNVVYCDADSNYLLRGRVGINTLITIEPGTVIFGEKATTGYLVIERGADIEANGTFADPIIMTSDQLPGDMDRGDWGGLVIHGLALANCAACSTGATCVSEGAAGIFCGPDDNDDAGTLRYVRIEYPGIVLEEGNELNCLTMNAVGRNTTIDYVQCHMGADDTFEWFGGTVNCSHLVSTGTSDDNFDWQLGYRGKVQCAVAQMYKDLATADKGIEADNRNGAENALPRSNPTMSNLTLIGRGTQPGLGSTIGVHLRLGTGGTIVNSVIMGFLSAGIDVDDVSTYAQGCGAALPIALDCDARTGVPGAPSSETLVVRSFPNPAVDNANISFSLPTSGRTRVDIFDAAGRRVANLLDRTLPAGAHEVRWNLPKTSAAGNYFYRVASGNATATGKIVSIR